MDKQENKKNVSIEKTNQKIENYFWFTSCFEFLINIKKFTRTTLRIWQMHLGHECSKASFLRSNFDNRNIKKKSIIDIDARAELTRNVDMEDQY